MQNKTAKLKRDIWCRAGTRYSYIPTKMIAFYVYVWW